MYKPYSNIFKFKNFKNNDGELDRKLEVFDGRCVVSVSNMVRSANWPNNLNGAKPHDQNA